MPSTRTEEFVKTIREWRWIKHTILWDYLGFAPFKQT
jgi:hypothetical protein